MFSRTDLLVAVALAFVGVTAITISLGFPGDAGVFPIAMSGLLILSCGFLTVQAIWKDKDRSESDATFDVQRFATWIGLAILLFMMVWQVDFYLAVFAFTLLSYILLARCSFMLALSVAALFTIVLFFGFDTLLGVPTPSRLQSYVASL